MAQLAAHFRTVADRLTKDGWREIKTSDGSSQY